MARKLHKREIDLTPNEAQELAVFMIKYENNNIRLTWEGNEDADVTAQAVYYAGVDEEEILETRTLGK